MVRTLRRGLAGLLLVLSATHATAGIPADTAEQLMRSSGLWQQLEGVGPQLRAGLTEGANSQGLRLKPAEAERLLRNVDTAYATDHLRATVLRHIAAPVTDADLRRYLALLKSPAGMHFNTLGLKAIDAALVEAGQALGRGLPGVKDAANT